MADITNRPQQITFKLKVPTEQERKEARKAFEEGGELYKYRHLIERPVFKDQKSRVKASSVILLEISLRAILLK